MTRFIFRAAIIVGAVVGVACGGGDDAKATATATASGTAAATSTAAQTATAKATTAPASGNKFDPSRADAIAHAAMIAPADLPGGGWAITNKDDFSVSEDSASPSCAPMNAAAKAFQTALDANRSGRAQVELSKTAPTALLPSTAEFLVYIYPDTKAAAAPLDAYRKMVDLASFMKCLEDEMGGDPGMTAKVTKVTPGATVPDNGATMAFEVALTAGSVTFTMRVEAYAWQTSNALVGLNLSGPKDVVTADLSKAAVSKLQSALDAAAGAR